MRDVLHTLREARPAELDPDAPVDGDVRRAELAHAMAGRRAPGAAAGAPGVGLSLAGRWPRGRSSRRRWSPPAGTR